MHDPNCSFLVVFVFNLGLECLYWPSFLEEFFSETRSTEGSNLPHTYSDG
jgi:hypothetical protein